MSIRLLENVTSAETMRFETYLRLIVCYKAGWSRPIQFTSNWWLLPRSEGKPIKKGKATSIKDKSGTTVPKLLYKGTVSLCFEIYNNWFEWKSRQMAWSQGLSREIQIGRAFRRNALHMTQTAWKASKYWVFSGSYFPVCRLNTEIYGVNLRIQSKYKKIRTKKNSAFEHFLRFKFSKIQIINLVSSIR